MIRFLSLLVVALTSLATSSSAQNSVIYDEDETVLYEFEGIWAKQIAFAFKEFSKRQDGDWFECFDLVLVEETGVHSGVFLPSDDEEEVDENTTLYTFGRTACGYGISYEFHGETGDFIRKVVQR